MSKSKKSIGDLSNEEIVNSLLEDFQNDINLDANNQEDLLVNSNLRQENILDSSNDLISSTSTKIHNPKIIDFDSNADQKSDDIQKSDLKCVQDQTQAKSFSKDMTEINQEKDPDDEVDGEEKNIAKTGDKDICEASDDEGIDDTSLSEEEIKKLDQSALDLKNEGNDLFKKQLWKECLAKYNESLRTCPRSCSTTRSILYANQAAVLEKMENLDLAIASCSKSLTLNPSYLKVLTRRARLFQSSDKLDEALSDYQTIVNLDPTNRDAVYACKELPLQINERNEKLKDEMLGKLKDLGNMILRPFGLSTNNFQMVQDPNSGGYSVNFKQ